MPLTHDITSIAETYNEEKNYRFVVRIRCCAAKVSRVAALEVELLTKELVGAPKAARAKCGFLVLV